MYTSANSLKQKADETVYAIVLLAAATARDCKKYANLANIVTYLMTKLSLTNKNIVLALRNNNHPERLLVQCRIGSHTGGKRNRWNPPGHSLLIVVRL